MTSRGTCHDPDHRGVAGGRRIQTPRGVTPGPPATGCARRCSPRSSPGAARCTGCASSTCTPAPARSASRRGPGAPGVVTLVEQDRRTASLIADNAQGARLRQGQRRGRAGLRRPCQRPPAAPYDVAFLDPPYPLDDDAVDRRPRTPWSTTMAGAGRAGGRRALRAQPRARLARRASPTPRHEALRRDHALVRSRRVPAVTEAVEERACAPSRLPRVVRPGHQRAHRHRDRGPPHCSTRSWSRSASTSPRAGCSSPEERIEMLARGVRAASTT